MRMFNRGIENIKFLMEKHDAEWRREQGEDVELPKIEDFRTPVTPKPKAKPKKEGGLDENRFLHKRKKRTKAPQVESVQVLPSAEHHSWLYNEVMKAINDAAAKNKNSRVIAIFVPVLQNSKEFEDLPVDETITISSDSDSNTESKEILQENIAAVIPEVAPELSEIAEQTPKSVEVLEIVQETPESESVEILEVVKETAPESESEIEPTNEEISQAESESNEPDNLVFEEIPAEEPENNESESELIPPEENKILQEIESELESEPVLEEIEPAPVQVEEVIILEEPSQDVNELEELAPISVLDENSDDSEDLPEIKPLDNDDLDGIEGSITEEPVLLLPADDEVEEVEVIELEEIKPAPTEPAAPSEPATSESSETSAPESSESESESPESHEESESPEIPAELEESELQAPAPELEGDEIEILLEPEENDDSDEKIKVE